MGAIFENIINEVRACGDIVLLIYFFIREGNRGMHMLSLLWLSLDHMFKILMGVDDVVLSHVFLHFC